MKIKLFYGLALWLAVFWGKHACGQVVADTVMVLQARNGLPHFFQKLEQHQPVTIGYLGGSITEAAGYRVQTEQYFKENYPHSNITAINAGVGGTGSALGAFRVGPEILQHQPDLVFIEFAVNDAETDSLMVCNAIEGIIRQIKRNNKKTDICLLYTIYEPMLKDLQQGRLPRSVRLMERIAVHYQLPSINLQHDVVKLLNKDELVFHGEAGKDYGRKIVFTADGTHPATAGHTIYTSTIIAAFKSINLDSKTTAFPKPLYPGNFEKTAIVQPGEVQRTPGWTTVTAEKELQPYLKAYPNLMYAVDTKDSITITFEGTYMGIGDLLGPSAAGAVVISVDGGKPVIRNRFDSYCWFYRRSFYLVGPLTDAVHTVTIKKDGGAIDKAKLINGHSSVYGLESYQPSRIYIGNVMIIGKKL